MLIKIKKYLIAFIQLQLFINLFSWPILIAWGLPISFASPIGNFIFTPFLIAFLALSLLVFITEILFIPNSLIIYFLELLTYIWLKISSYISTTWLLYLAKPYIIVLLMIPILATVIVSKKRKLLYLVLFTISLIVSSYYNSSNKQIISIFKNNNKVQVIKVDNKLILLDTGTFSLKSSKSFIDFQLIPKITKNFGLSKINTIVTLKPGKQTCKTLCYFLKNFKVDYIYLSTYKKSISSNILNYINKLKILANKNNTKLILLDSNKYNLKFNSSSYIKLVENKKLKRSYYYYKIKAKINNTLIYEYCN